MSKPFVRLVVLNYNGAPFVYRCLEALVGLDYPADRHQIVVVDNASTDGSAEEVVRQFPDATVIANHENAGFPANNLAMVDRDGVDFVALVNSDAFVEPDWLSRLVAAAEADPSVGAWCPKILLEPAFVDVDLVAEGHRVAADPRLLGVRVSGIRVGGEDRYGSAAFGQGFWGAETGGAEHPRFQWTSETATLSIPIDPELDECPVVELRLDAPVPTTVRIDSGAPVEVDHTTRWVGIGRPAGPTHDIVNNIGSRLVDGGMAGDRGFLVPDDGRFDEPQDVFAWCGGGVLLRCDYLDDVGLFDERFFLYYEDTDLSWRGQARGWRYRTVPTAVMRHLHAASSEEGSPMFQHFVERNRLVMLTKNAPRWLVRQAVASYLRALLSFTLRDIVRPVCSGRRPDPSLPKRRVRSLVAWLQLVPELRSDRRRLRSRQRVPDAAITGWSEPQ